MIKKISIRTHWQEELGTEHVWGKCCGKYPQHLYKFFAHSDTIQSFKDLHRCWFSIDYRFCRITYLISSSSIIWGGRLKQVTHHEEALPTVLAGKILLQSRKSETNPLFDKWLKELGNLLHLGKNMES